MSELDNCITMVLQYLRNSEFKNVASFCIENDEVRLFANENNFFQVWFRSYIVQINIESFLTVNKTLVGIIAVEDVNYDIEQEYFQLSILYPFSKDLYINIKEIRAILYKIGVF